MKALRRFFARLTALFTTREDERRLREEFDQHLTMLTEDNIRSGLSPAEARRKAMLDFGSVEVMKEEYRDQRGLPWLDALASDVVFGWRQLKKHRTASAAAILSLALAGGACTGAFRLMDALLWRPMPVSEPQQLYVLSRVGIGFDGKPSDFDGWAYPSFQRMRVAVKAEAELIAISYAERIDLTYQSDQEMEKARVQYVSGWMFRSFGLNPALGRLLTEDDDRKPGAHPYAVLSHDYWTRRIGSDPHVIGRTFRLENTLFEIVGVGPEGFTGTETGTIIDVFLPTMMQPSVVRDDSTWLRTIARVNPNFSLEPIRQKLHAESRAFEHERAKGFSQMLKEKLERSNQALLLTPAASGASGLQNGYRRSLSILGVLAVFVLLIACLNVANLMTAQATARAREMALRVSIGAGRWRLIQLVMVEAAMLAVISAAIGGVIAWLSAPLVVRQISSPDNPVSLALPADLRVLGASLLLTLCITLLFGLKPALRASAVKPASALKGGEDPHARRRTMHLLIATQVAFCFLVLFAAGLLVATFDRLSKRPLGFSPDRILALEVVTQQAQTAIVWDQVADHLRAIPGVDTVALATWPILKNSSMNSLVSVDGAPPSPVLAYFLNVSPGWRDAMKIRLNDGRDLRPGDTSPGSAVVNESFAKAYFNGQNPIGKSFARGRISYQIVGIVKDIPYRSLREPILPVAYIPFSQINANGLSQPIREGTFIVRTTADPLALALAMRREVPRARPEFRVSNVHTQQALIEAQTLRERLLAMLGLFFAAVAALLAGVGLYGVLDYSVLQRRREIGIRMAIGEQGFGIARLVTRQVFVMVAAGALAGLGMGLAAGHYMQSLLYDVNVTDLNMLAIPALAILILTPLAALVPVLRAIRINPIQMLRAE